MNDLVTLAIIGTVNTALIVAGLRLRRPGHPPDLADAIRQALGPVADDEHREEVDRRLTRIETVLQSLESSVHAVLTHLGLGRYTPPQPHKPPDPGVNV